MKIFVLLLVLLGFAQAANPETVVNSAQPLLGALESLPDVSSSFAANYVPGYGFQANGLVSIPSLSAEPIDPQAVIGPASNILSGLASSIEGLEAGDWVSISFSYSGFPDDTYGTVRIKPGQPESLEVWLDGQRQ
jgi:hypothetical protein